MEKFLDSRNLCRLEICQNTSIFGKYAFMYICVVLTYTCVCIYIYIHMYLHVNLRIYLFIPYLHVLKPIKDKQTQNYEGL